MPKITTDIQKRLRSLGLSRDVVRAAWPRWWSDEAEFSPSALNDLKFSLSRKLGISAGSLFDQGGEVFVWKGNAKFKGLAAHTQAEQDVLANFGRAVAKPLLKCLDPSAPGELASLAPDVLREMFLSGGASAVDHRHLFRFLTRVGIPLVYLRVMPLQAKRMAAMCVRVEDRYAIFLAKDAAYYAPVVFNVAHELGHIARQHLVTNSALIDSEIEKPGSDEEEQQATEYALKLLTGRGSPTFDMNRPARTAAQLALAVQNASKVERIDPGVLAMTYGYYMNQWKIANGALKVLYGAGDPVWRNVNKQTVQCLRLERLTEDSRDFLLSVLGLPENV